MSNKRLTVVDLFAGAGGLSEGFQRQVFLGLAHVEMEPCACKTLLTRHIYWELLRRGEKNIYYDYLRNKIDFVDFVRFSGTADPVINETISRDSINRIKNKLYDKLHHNDVPKIDVFVGGPPCQAYSLVGRARDPYGMKNDPRNKLYKYYVELLTEFRPDIFVFENVPGILSAGKGKLWQDVQEYFRNAGYFIDYQLLNAADFLVPQTRKRVILIGWRKKLILEYPKFEKQTHDYLIKDILSDLPRLNPGEEMDIGRYKSETTDYLKMSQIRTNGSPLIQHITRPINEHDRGIYKIAIEKWRDGKQRLSYFDLPDKIKTHKNQTSFTDRFKVVADDLKVSHTLVAHISKDGHYYIHPDKTQLRSISVREAARIQSFPDDFKFEGPRTSQLAQIGNAVPPLMAECIAKKVREMLS